MSRQGPPAASHGVSPDPGLLAVAAAVLTAALGGCVDPSLVLGSAGTSGSGGVETVSGTGSSSTGIPTPDLPPLDGCHPDVPCQNKIDLLFVIDNSGTMAEEQLNLAKNFPMLIAQLQALDDGQGNQVGADVNIMVTTTDVDNPACHGWLDDDYEPARGSPISTPCTERIARFSGITEPSLVVEEACTDVCDPANPAAPSDQFIHFDRNGDNVEAGDAAAALACIGPQGIDGCGYEAPLESMLQALNPSACWNDPEACDDPEWSWIERPFLRDGAVLAIVLITDEVDCSVRDYSIMADADFMEPSPENGTPKPSSAICWHAGVECGDLDPDTGRYSGCFAANHGKNGAPGVPDDEAVLHPVSRYIQVLDSLRAQGREVIMLGILGVPEVTAHAETPPYEPTEGGIADVQYRPWRDPEYPAGDILPDEWADNTRAVNKQFEFGVGPGCTGYDAASGTFTGQAVPPVRIRSVCESLDVPDDPTVPGDQSEVRCCFESICDDDFSAAVRCLTGLIQNVVTPVG